MMTQRCETLSSENIKLRSERDTEMTRAVAMQTIMESVSAGLIDGITKMRANRRERQERELGVGGDGASPVFREGSSPRSGETLGGVITGRTLARDPAESQAPQSEPSREPRDLDELAAQFAAPARQTATETERQRISRLASEPLPRAAPTTQAMLATLRQPNVPFPQRGVRTDIEDPRLPAVEFGESDDTRSLRDLEAQISGKVVGGER
jgi:hypothetical protein